MQLIEKPSHFWSFCGKINNLGYVWKKFSNFSKIKFFAVNFSKLIIKFLAKAGKSGDQKFRREARLREIKSNRQKGFENNRKINDQEEIDEKENNINKKRLRENVDEEIEDIYNRKNLIK